MEAQVATDWIRPLPNVAVCYLQVKRFLFTCNNLTFCVVSRIDELELADSSAVI